MLIASKTTHGIRVSVESFYEGRFSTRTGPFYYFTYRITIENRSKVPVKLLGRHWYIHDMGGGTSEVEGAGVVGLQPELLPNQTINYKSSCPLRGAFGLMEGVYNMMGLHDSKLFQVNIPQFYLLATPKLN